jgi:hypothetical protein
MRLRGVKKKQRRKRRARKSSRCGRREREAMCWLYASGGFRPAHESPPRLRPIYRALEELSTGRRNADSGGFSCARYAHCGRDRLTECGRGAGGAGGAPRQTAWAARWMRAADLVALDLHTNRPPLLRPIYSVRTGVRVPRRAQILLRAPRAERVGRL